MQLLLAGDKDEIRAMLVAALRALGHRVGAASDAREALMRIAAELPDVVIVDLDMPGTDSLQVARAVRRNDAWDAVHLVAYGSFGNDVHAADARAAGFDQLLAKPASIEQLAAAITHAVRARWALRDAVLLRRAAAGADRRPPR